MNQQHTSRQIGIVPALMGLLTITLAFSPCHAEVGLRVEAHPITAPIDAYVRVTEGSESVTGLTPADFAVTLDGAPVAFTLTLPPNQDSTQKVSVVIVINNSEFFPTRNYSPLLEQLAIGDLVSVVKYAFDFDNSRQGGLWVLPFTTIDDGPGLAQIQDFIEDRQELTRTGPRFLRDGLMEGTQQFAGASATLPEGPKAIVSVECCFGRGLSQVIASANAGGIPIFEVNHGGDYPEIYAPMRSLATKTGGIHVEGRRQNAIASMGSWLRDGYRVRIPRTAVRDCKLHKLGIAVGGESKSVTFSRCDTTPEDFRLRDLFDADVSKHVRARAVITGIERAVPVRLYGEGQYSVGCTSPFTSEPGTIQPGQSVCVRHTTAASGGLQVDTLLIVGGVAESFSSQTASSEMSPPHEGYDHPD